MALFLDGPYGGEKNRKSTHPFVASETGCRRQAFLGFCLRVHLSALLLDSPYGGEKALRDNGH